MDIVLIAQGYSMVSAMKDGVSAQMANSRPTKTEACEAPLLVIEARPGWRRIDWGELVAYRDLFRFLVWRGIKARYAQSALGVGWAIIQPLCSMVIFTIIFGKLVKVGSDGVPYALFSFVALAPWTYFSNALTDATNSLVTNSSIISKIYFPRLILPLSAVASKLVDFSIALIMLAILMAFYRAVPGPNVVFLPLLIGLMVMAVTGFGLWLTSLAVQYRDVSYATPFALQILMYLSPVVYSAGLIPDHYRLVYGLNPMVGVIEGFRSALIGEGSMPWDLIAMGTLTASFLTVTGALQFRRMERVFSDVA